MDGLLLAQTRVMKMVKKKVAAGLFRGGHSNDDNNTTTKKTSQTLSRSLSLNSPSCLAASRSLLADAPKLFPSPDGVRQEEGRGGGGGRDHSASLFPVKKKKKKRTPRSMRRASPCSIDRREALMPSIALPGLVEAEQRVQASERMKGRGASSHLNSKHFLC